MLLAGSIGAQLTDDFSDGDITMDPVWLGDVSHFRVNAGFQLQLDAPDAGSSVLFTEVQFPDSVQWEFFINMDFAPSQTNRLRVYLFSDSSNFSSGVGYFVEIGENGSEDAIHFYRQMGTTELLASGPPGMFASDPAAFISVIRDGTGNWTFRADSGPGSEILFTTTDTEIALGRAGYFGVECTYTASRKDLYFFDDFRINEFLPDVEPPVILEVQPLNATTLQIIFDESLDPASATSAGNYSLNQEIGLANSALLESPTVVITTFGTPMISGNNYILQVAGVADTTGNAILSAQFPFDFLEIAKAAPYEILITEIMADPSPPLALPNAEYVELYNPTDLTFNLEGYTLQSGSKTATLPAIDLSPATYLIISDEAFEDVFELFGNAVGLPDFPGLTNSGAELAILDAEGTLIHQVNYSINWYRDPAKDDGGWSLEMMNSGAPCALDANWAASNDLRGGTPGAINSIAVNDTDEEGPALLSLFPESDQRLLLRFDEALDLAMSALGQFTLTPDIPIASIGIGPMSNELLLNLSAPLQPSILYSLTVNDVADCVLNVTAFDQELTFGIPEQIDSGDIIINEVLFNPETGGARFVELYNRSSKFLNVDDLIIGDIQGNEVDARAVTQDFLLFPNHYVAFTPSPEDILSRYTVLNPEALLENTLPSFDDERGNVTLYTADEVIDVLDYTEEMHHPLLDDQNGVSLERISPEAPTQAFANWHSAAQSVGFATPTYENSQLIIQSDPGAFYSIDNRTFSPDGDGFEDLLLLSFFPDQPGFLASVTVFDAAGRYVDRLMRNELIGQGSLAQWDGTAEDGQKARLGIYLLYIELQATNGRVLEFKESCVLAERL